MFEGRCSNPSRAVNNVKMTASTGSRRGDSTTLPIIKMAAIAVMAVLALDAAAASVLVPTYVLPPAAVESRYRDQRSILSAADSVAARSVQRLVGGHMRSRPDSPKGYGDATKNSLSYYEKDGSNRDIKFAGVVAPDKPGRAAEWNQGQWDDGMLMSSAGNGKEKTKSAKDDDEDKKTLSDQVAEGKYGLIQKEIFQKLPKRPGILSYEPNPETQSKDNAQTLGGLKKDEIWLAEDHLLVLKGGSYPEHAERDDPATPWPPIDAYEAPRRQVKLPERPAVPPPFPVRLSDDGPLIFLTPNGSIPAPFFPPYARPGASLGSLPPPSFPFPPGANAPQGPDAGNITSGGPPFPNPPFPVVPGNESKGGASPPLPFPNSINGSIPDGFPPGAAFLPPPGNQSDLYDEEDLSIYYPPPYNFSYHADNGTVPAGPLVPGIILPPPPDFFAPLEDDKTSTTTTHRTTNRPKPTTKRPSTVYINRTRPPTKTRPSQVHTNDHVTTSTPRPYTSSVSSRGRQPPRVISIPNNSDNLHARGKPIEKPLVNHKQRPKTTQKPAPYPVSIIYDYPDQLTYNDEPVTQKPFAVYGPPEKQHGGYDKTVVPSTPIPLHGYYSNGQNPNGQTYVDQNNAGPGYFNQKQPDNSLASFYFYEETPKNIQPPPAAQNFFDYNAPANRQPKQPYYNKQAPYNPSPEYQPIEEEASILILPQRQGSRTLTQEYFSIQQPKAPQSYNQQRPDSFYHQIADIQQTIDYFSNQENRAQKQNYQQRPNAQYRAKPVQPKPVYQFSFQSNQRPDQQDSFRAPKLDSEPFRPMIGYSKPFDLEDFQTTPAPYHQQYLVEKVKVTTETPIPSKYYQNTHSEQKNRNAQKQNGNYQTHTRVQQGRVSPRPYQNNNQVGPSPTPNPADHAYYTKQDERYVDDITKNYFTIFGKKIEGSNRDVEGIAVTAPIRPIEESTIRTPINNAINIQYENDERVPYDPPTKNKEISLAGDTLVNYRQPKPYIEPESEFIPIVNPELSAKYEAERHFNYLQQQVIREQQGDLEKLGPYHGQPAKHKGQNERPLYTAEQLDMLQPNKYVSLAGDTDVNYRRPLPPVNTDSEYVDPQVNAAGEGRPGSFVSYRLPGEGAHVYFLTPQAVKDAGR